MPVITMTREEREAFLAGVHVGVVCIADGDRAPIAAPIWYDYAAGGDLRIVTGRDSRKGKRLVPGAKLSLCAQQEAPPYKYVTVEGVVAAVETANVERDVRPVARRYLGEQGGDMYVEATREMYVDDENVVVRVRIERWLSADYAKEWNPQS